MPGRIECNLKKLFNCPGYFLFLDLTVYDLFCLNTLCKYSFFGDEFF